MKKPYADLLRAQSVADSLIKEFVIEEAPTPIIYIAHREGLETESAEFEEALIVSGLLDFENLKIIVNQRDPVEVQAFTIARGLGHWILHKQELYEIPELRVLYQYSLGGEGKSFYDKEAICFASHLLVPQELFNKSSHLADDALVVKFQVPEYVITMLRVSGPDLGKSNE